MSAIKLNVTGGKAVLALFEVVIRVDG